LPDQNSARFLAFANGRSRRRNALFDATRVNREVGRQIVIIRHIEKALRRHILFPHDAEFSAVRMR